MKIVADENIPLVRELFAGFGEVVTLPGRKICSSDVADADVLLVRSVTRVDEALLRASKVKFVGTCTIGTDHMDKAYLNACGISFASAPGCNAYGVVQYVCAALAQLGLFDTRLTVGIVGCGNVGGRLYRALKSAGIRCVCYDPFLTQERIADLAAWEALFDCDVICTHTPLTKGGPYPTYHMMSSPFIARLKTGAVLLNAGRGEVIDNQALLAHFQAGNSNDIRVVLDVWEPEPDLDTALLGYVSLATPHIAGYSFEGRTNGSLMIYEALAVWLGEDAIKIRENLAAKKSAAFGEPTEIDASSVGRTILATHDIAADDQRLREKKANLVQEFDLLRKHYPKRREFSHYTVCQPNKNDIPLYRALGFGVKE